MQPYNDITSENKQAAAALKAAETHFYRKRLGKARYS